MDATPGAEGESGVPSPGAPETRAPATRADRVLLGVFAVYVLLVLVAAFAQLTDNRALLDLFDLRRLFTR